MWLMTECKAPRVSVIIPTFQRRHAVVRAVASVLAQTYRDFELIVIDDGSTDGTKEALAPYGDLLRYRWRPNGGVAAARNTGLQLAQGKIVAFLDSDNQWLPHHLAIVTKALEHHSAAVLASTCPNFIVTGRERASQARLVDYRTGLIFEASQVGFVSGVAVQRNSVAEVGGFDERLAVMEDSDLWVRLATRGPFSVLRRRTIVHQETAGSLRDRGRRAGAYLIAAQLAAQNLATTAAQLPARHRDNIIEQAQAMERFAVAMQALDHDDAASVREHLEAACSALPLGRMPVRVWKRVVQHLTRSHERAERLRAYTMLAELWPEASSDTARYMQALAIATALRSRRPIEASRLLASWPRGQTGQFVRRLAPQLGEAARRSHSDRRHRGRETAALQEPLRNAAAATGATRDRRQLPF